MIKVARGCLGEEELAAVREAFEYGYFGLAYKVGEFERNIAEYLHAEREAVATNTGTSALHLALAAAGVGEGDEVIVPTFTFVASVQAVLACGATPVLCDIEPDTLLMDINDARRRITPRTKAIMPVHYAGNPCRMDELLSIKDGLGIRIIEDAAHAFGSEYRGRKIGSFGDIACFSFDSIKVMTCGEGGAVVSGDRDVIEKARVMRLVGIDRKSMNAKDWKERSWDYDVHAIGYRYHMSNINAAIGVEQLKKLDGFIAGRRHLCSLYRARLQQMPGLRLLDIDFDAIAPFMFPVLVRDSKRNGLREYLKNRDIETGISYIPCHRFSLLKDESESYPVADRAYEEILCLPLHYGLDDGDVGTVADSIKSFFEGEAG